MQEITFDYVRKCENIRVLVDNANHCLEMIGYTDHDGNTLTEACAYGLESCVVCASNCTEH